MDAQDGEARHQDLEHAARLARRQGKLLHQLEGQEGAIRENLRLHEPVMGLLALQDRRQLSLARPGVPRLTADHAEIQGRDVGVRVGDQRHGRVVALERAQHQARRAEGAGGEDERPRLVPFGDAGVGVRCLDAHAALLVDEAAHETARTVGEAGMRSSSSSVHMGR